MTIELSGGESGARQNLLSSLTEGRFSIETASADSPALTRAFENTYDLLEHLLDLNTLLGESRLVVVDSDKDYVGSLQGSKVGNVLADQNSKFIRIPPFTERVALKIRHDFVTTLADSPVKRMLCLSLKQSFPLPKSCPREFFDLLIPRLPKIEDSWLRFLEAVVLNHCREWLAGEGILIGRIESEDSGEHPALFYSHQTDFGLCLGTPVVVGTEQWSGFKAASYTPNLAFEVARICVPRPDVYWQNVGLKPDGVFFSHRSARRNRFHSRSVFHYFRPEAHPGREDILSSQCESVFVLKGPISLIEKMSPLGVLHYGFEHDKVFPVFDGVTSLITQTGFAQIAELSQ